MSCLGCSNRFLYCHDICDDYAEEKKMREELKRINRNENMWTVSDNRIQHMGRCTNNKVNGRRKYE